MFVKLVGIISCLILYTSALYAQNPLNTVSGKHLANSLTCNSCHETVNPVSSPSQSSCIGCHGEIVKIPVKEIHEGKRVIKINVHDSHYGEIDCLNCHKIHSSGKLMCNECHHYDIKVK